MGSETASMRIKSYFSSSVEQAIHDAREELGGEATLITSRRAAPEARHLGLYEVVFGVTEIPAASEPNSEDLNGELTILRDQLDGIKRLLKLSGAGPQIYTQPEIGRLYEDLLSAGLEENLARLITEEASALWQAPAQPQRPHSSSMALRALAAECLGKRLQFAPEFGACDTESSRAVVLVGPPGAGKTTTLAKIAIQECLSRRLSLRVISADLHRVASHEKLRSLAGIMGAGFTSVSTAHEFMEAVEEFRNKNILLIDTPGYSHRDWDSARDMAGLLARLKRKEVHLVLPAFMKPADIRRCLRQYEEFSPAYLLFTRLDETESNGAILSAALETARPLSFLTRGQGIPEDLEAASPAALLGSLFGRERAEATSAA